MSPQTKRFVGVAMIIAACYLPVFGAGTPELLLMLVMVATGIWLVRRSKQEGAAGAASTVGVTNAAPVVGARDVAADPTR